MFVLLVFCNEAYFLGLNFMIIIQENYFFFNFERKNYLYCLFFAIKTVFLRLILMKKIILKKLKKN